MIRLRSKVRSGSLLSTDFKQGQLPVGPKGDQGRQGSPGSPGYSVTSAALQSGDSNCPNGGSSFTSASGTTYACTGNAVAYAEVSSSGVGINPQILGGYNVISATNPSTGLYCLTLSAHPHVGVASNNGDGGGAVMSV